jgi:MFS family permease
MPAAGGWATVAVVWVTLAVGFGVFFSFSVFFVPLLEEFRWSRALIAGAFSISTVVQGMLAPVAGMLADRFGPRPVILGGVIFLGGASLLASTISAPWHLYLYTGVAGAVGMVGLGWVPMSVLLSHWFSARRGRVVGMAFSGMGVGVFVIGPLAQWLIATSGWRTATATLGAGTLLLLLPLVWLGARDPVPAPTRPAGPSPDAPDARASTARGDRESADGRPRGGRRGPRRSGSPDAPVAAGLHADPALADALRDRVFWALFAAYFFTPLAVFAVFTHQVAFAVDLGFDRLLVASIFGVVGLMSSVGRVGFGVIADRIGGALAATISFGCTAGGALALLVLDATGHVAWLWLYALLFGLGFGARGPIITAIATERFGGRRFGVIYGALNLGNGIGAAIAPWFGGFVHDVSGSYRLAFLSAVLFSAAGAACFWLAARRES